MFNDDESCYEGCAMLNGTSYGVNYGLIIDEESSSALYNNNIKDTSTRNNLHATGFDESETHNTKSFDDTKSDNITNVPTDNSYFKDKQCLLIFLCLIVLLSVITLTFMLFAYGKSTNDMSANSESSKIYANTTTRQIVELARQLKTHTHDEYAKTNTVDSEIALLIKTLINSVKY